MRLLLDLGNTRLKWALQASTHAWIARGAEPWSPDLPAKLQAAWSLGSPVRQACGASVVDASREAEVAAAVGHAFGVATQWLRTPAHGCGVRNAYAAPERLGIDRFLLMVAAYAAGHAPCVLASAGTALTLDALHADGRHLGGLIAPGVRLMQQALLGATAQVRPERAGQILDVADNTADAVASGCWQAALALIERFAERMAVPLGGAPALLLSGGDAGGLQPLLARPAQLFPDGVLRGLAVWADTAVVPASPG